MKTNHLLLLAGTILSSAGLSTTAYAQEVQSAEQTSETAEPASGDIVVTATRQSESLSRVPLSISAFTQASLDKQNVRGVEDIARITPGLTFARESFGNGIQNTISIRGIVATDGFATTGVYIDNTPIAVRTISTATNAYPKIFDLDRVEVLRGPQGTLFGAGAQGGVVRFITPKPSLTDYSVYGRAEVLTTEGGNAGYEGGIAVGGPIVEDKLGFRVSASLRRDPGWVDRVNNETGQLADKDSNWTKTFVTRAALTWEPVEGLSISPSIYFQTLKLNDSFNAWEQLSDPSKGKFVNGNVIASPAKDRFYLPALAVSYDFGDVAIESNTSYFNRKLTATYDYTGFIGGVFGGTPYPYQSFPGYQVRADFVAKQKTVAQEIRLRSTDAGARLRWVVGAFWTRMQQRTSQQDYDPDFPELIMRNFGLTIPEVFGPLARTDTVFDRNNVEFTVDKQLSGFAQVDYRLAEGLTATAGVRVSKTNFRFKHDEYGMAVSENHTTGSAKETPITPKFGLSWQVNPQHLIYANVVKGFRIGGANPVQNPVACANDFEDLGIDANPTQYKSDTVWNYELGAKSSFANGRVRVAASVFRIDWSNIQRSVSLPTCGLGYIDNLGSARSQGFDLSGTVQVVDGLTLGLELGYTQAKYVDTIRAASGAVIVEKGDSLGVPSWTAHPSAEYEFGIGDTNRAYGRVDYQFIGRIGRTPELNPDAATQFDPDYYQLRARNLVDLRVGLRTDNLDVSVFAANLLDETRLASRRHDFRGMPLFFIGSERPRTFGATVTARY